MSYIERETVIKELASVLAPTPSESYIVEKCIDKVNGVPEIIVVDDINIIRKMVIHGLYKVCLEKNYGPTVFNELKAEQNRLFDNYISTTQSFLKEKLTLSEEQLEYLNAEWPSKKEREE